MRAAVLRSAAVAVALCAGLAGCGEKAQTAKVRKSDVAASQGSAAAAYQAPGWKSGDATAWEAHLKARSQNQNEYVRIGNR